MANQGPLLVFLVFSILFILQNGFVRGFITEDIQSLEELDNHLANYRLKRSIEGASTGPCSKTGGVPSIYPPYDPITNDVDSCTANGLPNTRCNDVSGVCECDPFVSSRFRLSPETAICLPLAYVNESQGRCLPTVPDMCSLLVSGSVCRSAPPPVPQLGVPNTPALRCVCQYGGAWPNCTPHLGSPCQNTTVCQYRLPNSYCANIDITTRFGTCQCPRANQLLGPSGYLLPAGTVTNFSPYTQTTTPNAQQTACVPLTCPPVTAAPPGRQNLDPCNNDNLPAGTGTKTTTCTTTASGYQCTCNTGTRGRAHNSTTPGRCCLGTNLVCSDYSGCFDPAKDICDGTPQCNNCFDESSAFACTSAWPLQCGPVPAGRSAARSAAGPADFAKSDTSKLASDNKE